MEHFCEFIIWTDGSGDAVLRYFLICNSRGHLVELSGPVWAILREAIIMKLFVKLF